jgi:hypothetical protein
MLATRAAGWKLIVIRFVCTLIPVGAAIVVAVREAARQSNEFGY